MQNYLNPYFQSQDEIFRQYKIESKIGLKDLFCTKLEILIFMNFSASQTELGTIHSGRLGTRSRAGGETNKLV